MLPYQAIRRKRDGEELPPEALRSLLLAYDEGTLPDYQMAAFLMAVYYRGLSSAELNVLVEAILASGKRVSFEGATGSRVGKHSTGGVGDKLSLIVVPLVASLGVQVPKMSGRGLGHSGGTVDKLESIAGFRTDLSLTAFRSQVLALGTAIMGTTPEVAPLDRRLYALRDVTATVESVPLIAASIMSKKIAEGNDALVLDVKVGGGSFLRDEERALELASTMIRIAADYRCEAVALLTAMDRPLGRAIGNALEVREAIDTLGGGGPSDVRDLTIAVAAEMLRLAGVVARLEDGREAAERALEDGAALEMLRRLVATQGGDASVVDDPGRLPSAPVRRSVVAARGGRVEAMDARAIGEAVVELGAGRRRLEDVIDPAVGVVLGVALGDRVQPGDELATVHARDEAAADTAAAALGAAITIGARDPQQRPLISHRVTAAGAERLR